ncbi:Anaphase-promoting complex subunit 10, partial [Stegodyphus mimosarum]
MLGMLKICTMSRLSVKEAGSRAAWYLSSWKSGFGIDKLRDNDLHTYWQSDGNSPHTINIQFHKKTVIKELCMYVDYKLDESYTPSKISIRSGSHSHASKEVTVFELDEPHGWVNISLENNGQPVKAHFVQIAILSNHSGGRDCRVRQVRIVSPLESSCLAIFQVPCFSTTECMSYSSVR